MAEKVYPEWVQKHREKGTTVKKVGNNYYLYKHSSKRVPGKKYPVPVDSYIGKITPEGVVKGDKQKVSTGGEAVVKEFGFSKAMEILCPDGWKGPLGKDWEKTLDYIIVRESPESYLQKERAIKKELPPHIQLGAQKSALLRRMSGEHGVSLKELKSLSTIYLIYMDGRKIISKISEEQQDVLDRLKIRLEVD